MVQGPAAPFSGIESDEEAGGSAGGKYPAARNRNLKGKIPLARDFFLSGCWASWLSRHRRGPSFDGGVGATSEEDTSYALHEPESVLKKSRTEPLSTGILEDREHIDHMEYILRHKSLIFKDACNIYIVMVNCFRTYNKLKNVS